MHLCSYVYSYLCFVHCLTVLFAELVMSGRWWDAGCGRATSATRAKNTRSSCPGRRHSWPVGAVTVRRQRGCGRRRRPAWRPSCRRWSVSSPSCAVLSARYSPTHRSPGCKARAKSNGPRRTSPVLSPSAACPTGATGTYLRDKLHLPLPGLTTLRTWSRAFQTPPGLMDCSLKIMRSVRDAY